MRRAALACLLAAAAAGCASTPQATPERDADAKRFVPHPASAAIYVYRNDFRSGDEDEMDSVLYVDDRLVGATLPGTYFRVDVRPGVRWLRGTGHDVGRLKLEARAGEIHFVALNVAAGHSRFRAVPAAVGRRELERCCVLLENWAPGQRPLLR
ncbi:MAG TPA: hypothetical protein VNK67_07625 [Burkholderiales bacterium]|nr:hypothetical protein [Burkholderiales bacterium]